MANKLRFVFPFRSITRTMAITADRLIVSPMIHPIKEPALLQQSLKRPHARELKPRCNRKKAGQFWGHLGIFQLKIIILTDSYISNTVPPAPMKERFKRFLLLLRSA